MRATATAVASEQSRGVPMHAALAAQDSASYHPNRPANMSDHLEMFMHRHMRVISPADSLEEPLEHPPSALLEPVFDVNLIGYGVFCRFVELLSNATGQEFSLTCKANYLHHLKLRGLVVTVNHGQSPVKVSIHGNQVTCSCQTPSDYSKFRHTFARFAAFMRLENVSIQTVEKEKQATVAAPQQAIPVPRVFPHLAATVFSVNDVCFLAANYYHASLQKLEISTKKLLNVDQFIRVLNQVFEKMPHIAQYTFKVKFQEDISFLALSRSTAYLLIPPAADVTLDFEIDHYNYDFPCKSKHDAGHWMHMFKTKIFLELPATALRKTPTHGSHKWYFRARTSSDGPCLAKKPRK